MAVVNTKSTIVTNADASPIAPSSPVLSHGRLREQVGTVEVAAADTDASVFRMHRLFSSWRVSELGVLNDAITSGSVYDLGIYDTAERGGAVITQEVWASDVTMVTARVTPLDATFEALNIDKIEKAIWEAAGLTTDPRKFVDVCFTASTVGSGAGTISSRCRYVDGS